jgi:uncharacterized protein YggE
MKTASAAVLALAMALPFWAARPARSAEAPAPATLTLSAEGVSRLAPDMASISLGVVTEAPTAGEALKLNAERMTRVIAALRNAGLAERDLQTSGLSVSPQYDYPNGQPPALRGYQAANQVTATVRDLRRLGPILDSTASVGVNSAGQVSFGLSNPLAAENAAREAAVKALNAKADLYARATGHTSVRLTALSEGGLVPQPRPMMKAYAMAAPMAEAAPTPVAPGELNVSITVNGVFEMVK